MKQLLSEKNMLHPMCQQHGNGHDTMPPTTLSTTAMTCTYILPVGKRLKSMDQFSETLTQTTNRPYILIISLYNNLVNLKHLYTYFPQ